MTGRSDLTRKDTSSGGSQAPAIQAIPHVLHGVECYEAWRDGTDCPHEKEVVDA